MLLSLIIFFPILAAIVTAFLPQEKMVRAFVLLATIAEFVLSILIFKNFDASTHQLQMAESLDWIPSFGVQYFLAIDGISLWLVLLTTFLTPITILASWNSIGEKVKAFHIAMLVLETAMLGAFLSIDTILFYVFWELMLIPMYLLIGVWGGEKRIYAAGKFFIYTMVGSVFMLVAIIGLMYINKEQTGQLSANLLDFYKLKIPFNIQALMFLAFSVAFAIKVPMFPLHTWLPDAHVQAPTPGSVILAGVLLKMGTYGFIRFAIPLFPDAATTYAPIFLGLATFGIIYGALVAMVQPDMKKLVAYSSVSHLGYVVLGLFAYNAEGVTGSLYQMLNHGISTGALFLLVGIIYERTHSREIDQYGGLAASLPLYSIFFLIVTLSSIAVPGTNGFIGEFLILLGAFKASKVLTYIAVTGVIWGAVYMLWMYKKVFFGEKGPLITKGHHLQDMSVREIFVMVPMVIMIFWMGLYPNYFLDKTKASLDYFVQNRTQYHLTVKTEQTRQVGALW